MKGQLCAHQGCSPSMLLSWCRSQSRTISLATAKASVLCRAHNNALSVVDAEAKRLKDALVKLAEMPSVTEGNGLWPGPETIHLSGTLFSRWLCKTHCNMLTIDKRPCDEDFVRYAFGLPASVPFFFYTFFAPGQLTKIDRDHFQSLDFYDGQGNSGFYVNFFGMHWIATNCDLSDSVGVIFDDTNVPIPTKHLTDRLRAMIMIEGLPHGVTATKAKVEISWD